MNKKQLLIESCRLIKELGELEKDSDLFILKKKELASIRSLIREINPLNYPQSILSEVSEL